MPKSGVEHLANHPGWKTPKKVKHGVLVSYGLTRFKLSAMQLQLIADALEIINPDSPRAIDVARNMSRAFAALAEYAKSVE
jgi:hypothetical protein